MPNTILVSRDGAVGVVQLNRPQVLNALNEEVLTELGDAMRALDEDDSCRCIVLTGNDKAFAAGADIKETFVGATPVSMLAQDLTSKWEVIRKTKKPIIAAVSGFALGGGCELAMICDIIVASETAKFGQPEINLGLLPGYAGSQRLPRLVGRGRALELLLTGAQITAEEAWRIGLVNRVVPAAQLAAEARTLARTLASKPAVAVRYILDAVASGLDMSFADAQDYEATLFGLVATTEDMREGTTAFIEKRKPTFQGR